MDLSLSLSLIESLARAPLKGGHKLKVDTNAQADLQKHTHYTLLDVKIRVLPFLLSRFFSRFYLYSILRSRVTFLSRVTGQAEVVLGKLSLPKVKG